MKCDLKKNFLFFVLCLVNFSTFGQGRIYTKKVLLSDFSTKTTKIVVDASSSLENEISARWRISPYEFCSSEETNNLLQDNNFYVMRFIEEDGIHFLALDKGGKDNESDNLKKSIEVVRIPTCAAGASEGIYIGAIVDILQSFVSRALEVESVAYKGLEAFNGAKVQGYRLFFNADNYNEIFDNNEVRSAVGLCVQPSENGSYSYKMIITTDTHELLYFKRIKGFAFWSENDIKVYEKKNEIISR